MLDRIRRRVTGLAVVTVCLGAIGGVFVPASAQPASPPSPPAESAPSQPAQTPEAPMPERVPPKLASVTPLAHVEVMGKGPIAVVLIPHWTMDWSAWKSFMERNQDRYTMYAVTLPGFGSSDPPPLPVDAVPSDFLWLNNAALAVIDAIKERKIEKPLVMGHAMGGNVALRVALQSPALIRGVVSIEGMPALPMSGPGEPPVSKDIRFRLVNERLRMQQESISEDEWLPLVRKRALEWTRDSTLGGRIADASARVPKTVAATYLCEMVATDLTAELAGLQVPGLLIAAIPETPPAPGLTLESIRQNWRNTLTSAVNCQLVFFEASKALLMVDDADATDRAVAQFIQGQPVAGKPASAR